MARFLLVRVVGAVVTLVIAVSLAFALSRLAGDPVRNMLGDLAPAEDVAALRAELGYDEPLAAQWTDYMGDIATGDLGTSLRYGDSNVDVIGGRLWASLQLAGAALVIAVAMGLPVGMLAGRREGTILDRVLMAGSLLGQSVPAFWLAMIAIQLFAVNFGWLPAGNGSSLSHLVLPACTLATLPLARVARIARSATVNVLQEPYVLAARARGVGERKIVTAHVVRNTALPVLAIIGLQAGGLLSGAVTVEVVFGWPGMGSLAVQAVQFRDFPLVQSIVIMGAVVFVLTNLAVDVISAVVDPRVRVANG